jgi:hypothetical protein
MSDTASLAAIVLEQLEALNEHEDISIEPEKVQQLITGVTRILSQEDNIVHIHVPSGGKLVLVGDLHDFDSPSNTTMNE